MQKNAYALLFLLVGVQFAMGGIVPLSFNTNTTSSVTFSGTIPTYNISNTALNSSSAYANKYYTITSTGPRGETAMVQLKGSSSVICKSTLASTTITSTQSVQSEALPSFLFDFSGKVLSRTQIQSGSFLIGTSTAYPTNTLLSLNIAMNFSAVGTPTSYDWDFKLKYGPSCWSTEITLNPITTRRLLMSAPDNF